MWQSEALCADMYTELFFDQYEGSDENAIKIDRLCMTCPVVSECFRYGVETESWGVWGGVFLVDGKVDKLRNSHKTNEDWSLIYEAIADD